jgi:acyl-CoA thioester hydrolase
MSDSHETTVRVRYAETDRMGLLHHANYFDYFEMSRTEMLRAKGISYREVEDADHFLVIVDIGCKFKKSAYYDDLLTIRTTVARVTHVKIVHE